MLVPLKCVPQTNPNLGEGTVESDRAMGVNQTGARNGAKVTAKEWHAASTHACVVAQSAAAARRSGPDRVSLLQGRPAVGRRRALPSRAVQKSDPDMICGAAQRDVVHQFRE